VTAAEALDRKIAKAINGICEKCTQPAHKRSGLCLHHLGKAAARQRGHRQRLADKGLCSAGCGIKVGKRRRDNGTIQPRECPTCAKKHRARTAKARVRNEQRACVTSTSADPPSRGFWKMEHGSAESIARGWQKTARFVGRSRRGAPSKEDRWRDTIALVTDAIAEATATRDGAMPELLTERVTELGRVAKREAHALVADRLLRVARMLETAADEVCPGRVAEVRAERVDDDNGE
jgi:hypothetical protein